jgi:hypothetical protein
MPALPPVRPSRWILLRDVLIFQTKLWLDGLKDVVISPLSLLAAAVDIVFGPGPRGFRFYKVLRIGERLDQQLNLFRAAEVADHSEEGLFGAGEPGDPDLLGTLEGLGGRPPHPHPRPRR